MLFIYYCVTNNSQHQCFRKISKYCFTFSVDQEFENNTFGWRLAQSL
jgi:hypothetical protein